MARAVRIANASGFLGDRSSALAEMVEGGDVDVVTGDYLAELTLLVLGKQRLRDPDAGYARAFLRHLEPVLATVLARGIRVVVNAGGLNPAGLAAELGRLAGRLGLAPAVASVSGDDLRPRLGELLAGGQAMADPGAGPPPPAAAPVLTANAYLGAWGIVAALEAGADIVVCPRVTDASLVVGPAAWWHGWGREHWDALAGAVVAGHVLECGAQATGGNYSGFAEVADLRHPGFPLAEVAADGSSVITKHPGTQGAVTVGTVTAQLLYEIGSAHYLNPDVTTLLDTVRLAPAGPDRVAVTGTRGAPPPPTTKVAVTTHGGWRNEMTFVLTGLDLDVKAALFAAAARAALAGGALQVEFQRIGGAAPAATGQDEASALLRVVATSADETAVGRAFSGALVELALASYPGLYATAPPGPAVAIGAISSVLVAQDVPQHVVTLPSGDREPVPPPVVTAPVVTAPVVTAPVVTAPVVTAPVVNAPPVTAPPVTAPPVTAPPSAATGRSAPVASRDWGPRRAVPLGAVADARSGDKGSSANVGVWVRSERAYEWLADELTVMRFRALLPETAHLPVTRTELANLRGLNFVIAELLPGGAGATTRFDRQAKGLAEFLRSRPLDVPVSLLDPR